MWLLVRPQNDSGPMNRHCTPFSRISSTVSLLSHPPWFGTHIRHISLCQSFENETIPTYLQLKPVPSERLVLVDWAHWSIASISTWKIAYFCSCIGCESGRIPSTPTFSNSYYFKPLQSQTLLSCTLLLLFPILVKLEIGH